VLGCVVVAQWPDGAYLAASTTWIALVRGEPTVDERDYSHVAFSVTSDELRSLSTRLDANGIGRWQENWTEGDSLYFTDPDGHRLEAHTGDLRSRLRKPWDGLEILGDAPSSQRGKQSAAGVVLRAADDRIVIVEPTYVDHWNLPGGELEPGESPRDACRREVREELGLDLPIGRLLCVDHIRTRDAFRFLFDGGRVADDFLERCVLPHDELRAIRFATLDEAAPLLHPQSASRLRHCLAAMDSTLYLEDGEPCTP